MEVALNKAREAPEREMWPRQTLVVVLCFKWLANRHHGQIISGQVYKNATIVDLLLKLSLMEFNTCVSFPLHIRVVW